MTDAFTPDVSTSTTSVIYPPEVAALRAIRIAQAEAKKNQPKKPDWWNGPAVPLAAPRPTEFVRDMTNVSRRDGYLFVGQSSVAAVNEYAAFMSPNDAAMFHAWAKTHPSMDPRVWHSMAMAHIAPMDPDGRAVALADETRQAAEGTRSLVIGAPNQTPSSVPPKKHSDGMSANPMSWVAEAAHIAWSGAKEITRGATTVLGSGVGLLQSPAGVVLHDDQMKQDLALRMGLTWDEWQGLGWGASTPGMSSEQGKKLRTMWAGKEGMSVQQFDEWQRLRGATLGIPGAQFPHQKPRPDVMQQARAKLEQLGSAGGLGAQLGRAAQTLPIVQAVQHPGEQFDPNEGIFIAGKVWGRAAAAAEKSTDMRTLKEAEDYDKAVQARAVSINDTNEQAALSAGRNAIMDYLLEHPSATQDDLMKVSKAAIESTPMLNLDTGAKFDPATYEALHKAVAPTAWTPGRAVAQVFWDSDTLASNLVSGSIDFMKYLVADPAMLIPVDAPLRLTRSVTAGAEVALRSPTAALIRADRLAPYVPGQTARALETGQERVAMRTTQPYAGRAATATAPAIPAEAGGFVGAHVEARGAAVANLYRQAGRPDLIDPLLAQRAVYDSTGRMRTPYGVIVVGAKAAEWVNRPVGAEFIRQMTAETNAAKIMLMSNHGIPAETAKLFADATTEAEARAVFLSRAGREFNKPSQLGGYRPGPALLRNAALKDGWAVNLFRMAPKGGAFSNDPDVMFTEALGFARGIGLSTDATLEHLDRIVRAQPGDELYQTLYSDSGLMGEVTKHLMSRGASQEEARVLTRAFKGGMDDTERRNFEARIGSGSLAISDMSWQPKVLLEHEMLGSVLQLPNYRDVRRAAGIVQNITKSIPEHQRLEVIGKLANNGVSFWRNLTLMRPAYVLRELIDLTLSQGLAGHSSMLVHPIHAVSLAVQAAMGYTAHTLPGRLTKAILTGTDPERLTASLAYRRDQITKALADGSITRTRATGRRAALGLQEVTYRATAGQSVEAMELAKYLNRATRALTDFLGFTEGAARLAPSFSQTEARLNGDLLMGGLKRYEETGNIEEQGTMYNGLNAAHGNFVQDERAARSRGGTMTPQSRDVPEHSAGYARGITEALWDLHQDRDVRNLMDPSLTGDQVLDKFRTGTRDWKKLKRPDLLNDANPQLDLDFLSHLLDETRRVTIDDDLLTEGVRTGKFAGKPLDVNNRALREHINELKADRPGELLPAVGIYKLDPRVAKDWLARADRMVTWFFSSAGEVADMLVRAPAMREIYVKEVKHLGPALSPAAKAQAVANLRNAGDPKLAMQVQQINARGTLSIDSMEAILDGAVPQEMSRIFYDASRRGNYQVAFRTVAPFAQATFNTFKRWGLMTLANPQNMYRVVRPINALMQPGSAFLYELLGLATGDKSMQSMWTPNHPEMGVNGFFYNSDSYTNPGQPGERMFAMPVIGSLQSAFLSSTLGVPDPHLRAEARAQALNIAGVSLNPGMGPVVTMLASPWLGDAWSRKDTSGKIARFLYPYGLPEGNVVQKLIGTWLPTWAQKMARTDDGEYNVAQAAKMRPFLLATGDYDTSKPVDEQRLRNDSVRLAHGVYGMAALFGMITPTQFTNLATMALHDPNDPSGAVRFYTQAEMVRVFRSYTANRTGDQYDLARAQFMADFGVGALNSVLPLTTPTRGGVPTPTNDVWEFYTNNKDAYQTYLPVVGLLFPGDDLNSSEERQFSPEFSRAQRAAGERRYLTLDEAKVRSNVQIGWMLYNQKTREIDAQNLDERSKLVLRSRTRIDINSHYPDWTGEPATLGQAKTWMTMLKQAVKDPDIATLPSAPYIADYLKARDETVAWALDHGMGDDLSTQANEVGARLLIRRAQLLNSEDTSGGFRNFWNRIGVGEFERS